MNVGDTVKVNWKKAYPTMSGELISIDGEVATVKTELGKIDFPLKSIKKA